MTTTHRIAILGFVALLFCALLGLSAWVQPTVATDTPGSDVPTVVSATSVPGTISATPGPLSRLFTNIGNGFKTVGRTIVGWFRALGRLLGFVGEGLTEGSSCDEVSDCGRGLACLNMCFKDGICEVFEKLCAVVPGGDATRVEVKALYASCGANDLCTKGTDCRRTCPSGVECDTENRCLPAPDRFDSCVSASDCVSVCSNQPFPPIGPSAFRPVCQGNQCLCLTEETRPDRRITHCTEDALEEILICPSSTRTACTAEGCATEPCRVRLTCLTAPEYGGQCLQDLGCANVSCAEGSTPFCDLLDNHCRCRSTQEVLVNCADVTDCEGISCPSDQTISCVSGVCACKKKVLVDEDFVCTEDAQCPTNCPEDFSPACVDGSCACQRTLENVPVSCEAVGDCEAISCPADFEKACLDGICACTKAALD